MDLISRFEQYENHYGLVEQHANIRGSQNMARFTNEADRGLCNKICKHEKSLEWKHNLARLELEPGLLMRSPENEGGYQSHDDISAMIAHDSRHGTGFSGRFLKYGRENRAKGLDSFKHEVKFKKKWISVVAYYALRCWFWRGIPYVYNNMETEKFHVSAWMGKLWQVIATAKMVNGERVNKLERFWWCVAVKSAIKSESQDGWALSSALVEAYRNSRCEYKDIENAIVDWEFHFRYKSKYRHGGLGQVLAHYWGFASWNYTKHFDRAYDTARKKHPTIDTLWGVY